MTGEWLPPEEWLHVQAVMPIACVDAVPVRRRSNSLRVGLILRQTPHQGKRWCFVGGRIRRGESLVGALLREWRSVFGPSCNVGPVPEPTVVEYHPDSVPGRPHDPRKHAISMTYLLTGCSDPESVSGEALDFRWFPLDELTSDLMGFGQETVTAGLITRIDQSESPIHPSGGGT
jgi:ADP-ribose pyrophosphatase YjhB (NUDIX family)